MPNLLKYLLALSACLVSLWAFPAEKDDPVLMSVDGRDVSLSQFEYAYRRTLLASGAEKLPLKDLAESYADFQLKVLAARQMGLDTLDGFHRQLDAYRAGLSLAYLTDTALLDQALRRRYGRLVARGPRLQVTQIFRRLPQNVTGRALHRAVVQMDSIYDALRQAGPAAFADFVARFSDDKETRWLLRLDETSEFEDSVWSLNPGSYSRPFFTPRGLHIVRVLQVQPVPAFEALRDSLLQACPECVEEAARQQAVRLSKARRELSDEQVRSVLAAEYARLEQENAGFRLAVQAHADSLLAWEITRREMRAVPDSSVLQHYFARHHARYRWETPRYRGIVLLCSSRRVAKRARKMLKHLPKQDWLDAIRLLLNNNGVQVRALQGTFAPGQNAWVDEQIFKQGEAPREAGYEHVVLVGRRLKGPENFREVEQLVKADWQAAREARWVAGLRSDAKVEINQEVLKTVNYHRNKQ